MLGVAQVPADPVPMASYRNTELGLLYQYPASFTASDALAKHLESSLRAGATTPESTKRANCFSVPLAAQSGDPSGKQEFGLIVLLRFDEKCIGQELDPEDLRAAAQILMKILRAFGPTMTEDAVSYKLAGHAAAFVQGSAQADPLGQGAVVHAGSICTLVAESTMCWLLVDSNHKAMPALVATPVTFDEGSPLPLVPKDLAKPW